MPNLSIIKRQSMRVARKIAHSMGIEISKVQHGSGVASRPVGSMANFIEDLKTRGFEPRAILDVGANVADWSRMAAQSFPNASYLLIEPHAALAVHLEQFCRISPEKRRYVTAGAGATEGELTLTYMEGHDLAESSFLASETAALVPGEKRCKIKIVTIDSLYGDNDVLPDLVKLDIQGFELEALKGAQKLFGRTDVFILEVSFFQFSPNQPVVSDVVCFMATRGYEVYDLPGFLRRPLDAAMGQADFVFVRKGSVLRSSNKW